MSERRRSIEERFYNTLLPAVYRVRDHAQGEPLRALLAILEHELLAVRDDTQGLYEDWFIETCSEWVVPYIGDLLGGELQRSLAAEGFTARAYVANTLRYRRRKGTASVLEQLCRDVTGWPTRAVEYFQRLTTSQHMQHPRLHAPATAALRGAATLELATGPFGAACHSAELRSITRARGRFNIPNVGLHVWRLRPYPLHRVEARAFVDPEGGDSAVAPGRYHFDGLGRRSVLFNDPRAEVEIVHLAEERDVPGHLRRRALHAELAPLCAGEVDEPPAEGWFGRQPVLRVIRIDGGVETELRPPALRIANLDVESDRPDGLDPSRDWPRPGAGEVFVDPETGRLALPPPAVQAAPEVVLVDYVQAFSADLGGGPYDRRATVPDRIDAPTAVANRFHQGVSKDEVAVAGERIHVELSAAIDAWNRDALAAWVEGRSLQRIITIMDSRCHAAALTREAGRCIVMPPNSELRLVAARWPAERAEGGGGGERRREGRLDPMGVRPQLIGDIEVIGLADPAGGLAGGALELDGLLIEGALRILPGALGRLALRHCTLAPGCGGLIVESSEQLPSIPAPPPFADRPLGALASNADLALELTRVIVDGLSLTGPVSALAIRDSIVDRGGARRQIADVAVDTLANAPLAAVLAAGLELDTDIDLAAILAALATVPDLRPSWTVIAGAPTSIAGDRVDASIRTSTLLGAVSLRELEGSESLFVGRLHVQVVQAGCLRYSYAAAGSRSPRRFRCQPDLALAAAATAAGDAGASLDADAVAELRGRVRPLFTSTTHGHPGYCQLTRSTPEAITMGGEDGSEIGAFHMLEQAHRETNLRAALDKYLRFGLDAGVFYVT